ncbi:MAG: protein kinase domain-containing protein [Steroidobacteraceae bacterium]
MIGPYEISSVLGVGGMGAVYRARDVVLGRNVALKTLPTPSAADAERVARFRREAQILASLNHPNIAAIYGLDESHGVPVLVLELVEGPTLADRVERGALPLDEILPVARQIADALGAAHALGIVHRDLKPANIKVRPDGTVKVLDFGLAKVLESTADAAGAPQSSAITGPTLTRVGMILGTAACMSPEQARGRDVDKRSDIWSFGCVLFEMLTGRHSFEGEDVSDTLATVLTKDPDWNLLPPNTPPQIRRLLRRCLVKDRARRLADVADARLELDEPLTAETNTHTRAWRSSVMRWLPWSIAAGGVVTALWLIGSGAPVRPAADTNVYRTSVLLPERLGSARNLTGTTLALSPDGRYIAFVASDAGGQSRLWIRALDSLDARPLAGTANGQSPFWSPDSRWLAFVQDRRLKKVELHGGAIVTLCDSAMLGGAWSKDEVICSPRPTAASPKCLPPAESLRP